jgi:hypothetical protein
VRERFFTPRLRVESYDELNAWLTDTCIAWAKAHPHPDQPDGMIWEVFEEERPKLVPSRGRFDGFHAAPASVSKTCLARFDNNKHAVSASAVGRPVEIHAYADRIVIRQDGRIVAEHPRAFGRGKIEYDPWRYAPVLARKPGALRNGAPFKDWAPPTALDRVRRKLAGSDDGDRRRRAHRWIARGGGRLPSGAVRGRPFGGRGHQHPRASARSRTGGADHDARRFAAPPRADRRCPRYDQLRSA